MKLLQTSPREIFQNIEAISRILAHAVLLFISHVLRVRVHIYVVILQPPFTFIVKMRVGDGQLK